MRYDLTEKKVAILCSFVSGAATWLLSQRFHHLEISNKLFRSIRGFSSGRVELLCRVERQERDMAQVQVNQGVMKQVLKAPPGGARSVQVGDQVHVHCTGYIQATMGKFWR